MNRFRTWSMIRPVAFVAAVSMFSPPLPVSSQDAPAANAELIGKLRKVVESNCSANEKENVDDALATIHPDSPNYAATRQLSEKLFEALDLKYEMKSFAFLGADETYAVGRAKVRASSADPLKFKNNVSDLMLVFRKDKDDWKIWSQSILEIQFE